MKPATFIGAILCLCNSIASGGIDSPPKAPASTSARQSSAPPIYDARGTVEKPLIISAVEDSTETLRKEKDSASLQWTVYISAAGFCIASLGLFVAITQLFLFRKQLTEMVRATTVSDKSAEAANISAVIAEKTMMASLRPFLYMERFGTYLVFHKEAPPYKLAGIMIQAMWRNSSQNPALNVRYQAKMELNALTEIPSIRFNETTLDDLPMTVVAAGSPLLSQELFLSTEHLQLIEKGDAGLLFWAHCRYKDITGAEYHTETCHQFLLQVKLSAIEELRAREGGTGIKVPMPPGGGAWRWMPYGPQNSYS